MQGDYINKRRKLNIDFWTGFLLFSVILAEMPIFNSYAGYIITFFLAVMLTNNMKIVEVRTLKAILVIGIVWMLYVILTPSIWINTGYFNNSIIMVCMLVLILIVDESQGVSYSVKRSNFVDFMFGLVYFMCLVELIRFSIRYPEIWQGAVITDPFFLGHYHHVDFSVIVMSVFFIGIKRGYKKWSMFLAILAWFILPSRTLKLFFGLFLMLFFLRKLCMSLLRFVKLNKSGYWLGIMTILVVTLAHIWIFVLSKFFVVGEGHETLYNTSDYQRFESIVYAVNVIVQEKLILCGVDTCKPYEEIINYLSFTTLIGPHNSVIAMIINYSLIFTGCFFYYVTRFIDKIMVKELMPFVVAYFVCSCVLHDMFIGIRGFLFLIALIVPWKRNLRVDTITKQW